MFETFTTQIQFWRNEDGNYEGCTSIHNAHKKTWAAFHTKIVSSGSPSYTVQGGTSILRPNGQKKIRIFADEGQFSVTDKAEVSLYSDSSKLNLKSKLRENRNGLKDQLKAITPSETVVMQFQLVAAPKPKLKLAHACDICEKAFAYKEALLTHKRKQHKTLVQQVFQCTYCDYKGAKTKRAHEAHEQRHVNPPLKKAAQHQCDWCEKKFFGRKQLALHIEKRHREHLCRLACGEKFPTKVEERKHYQNKHKRQDSEVPPPCKSCGKEFSWSQGLQKHLRKSRCGDILKKQQQDNGETDKAVGGEEGGEKRMNLNPQRLKEVRDSEEGVVEDVRDGGEIGKRKGKKNDALGGKRGKKRNIEIEGRVECDYEKIRRNNIKEKEQFLADLEDE